MTGTDMGYSRFERWQPRNWSLVVKLAAVLLVPVLLGMALGVARIVEHTKQATALGALDRFVVLDGKAAELIDQVQRERDLASVFAANNRTGDKDALQTEFGTTDGKISDLDTAVGDPGSLGGAARTAYQQAKDNLSRLTELRDQVTAPPTEVAPGGRPTPGAAPPAQAPAVVAGYTGLVEPLLVLQAALDRRLDSPALAGPAAALSALVAAKEQVALQHAVIAVAIARGQMLPADADTVRASDAELGAAVDQFRAALDANEQAQFGGFISDAANNQRQQLKQTALSRVGAPRGQLGISPADWDNAYSAVADEMRGSAAGLRRDILKASAAQQDAARDASGIDSVILLLALVAAAAVVYLVGRSMLRPLRTLRSTALDIAERRLPSAVRRLRAGEKVSVHVDQVPVTSIDEIGQVARAFDEVHGQAVRLAAEQAALQTNVGSMFVNLSRRSQGLVERQLQLIEQLERNEQDAEQLANLFQLDHLATRMRRNSENLLVLAGGDLAKRGSQPVPLVDVLRAAVSEIEQYQRVVVQQPPSVRMAGRAANDMVHLVAELLDNATSFSAPETQVVVSSALAPDGSVLVEIIDQGVGMPGEDLIAANNRLSGPSEVDVSASRRMGLFVVGRLAARHRVAVRLASTDPTRGGGGITAAVSIPVELIVSGEGEQPAGDWRRAERTGSGRAADERAFGATVADRTGATAVIPVTTSGVVPRAGLASPESVPGGLVNGVPVNGASVNGSAVTGTGTNGVSLGGGRDTEPGGLPRRSTAADRAGSETASETTAITPRDTTAPATHDASAAAAADTAGSDPIPPAQPGALPRRSAGANLPGRSSQPAASTPPAASAQPTQAGRTGSPGGAKPRDAVVASGGLAEVGTPGGAARAADSTGTIPRADAARETGAGAVEPDRRRADPSRPDLGASRPDQGKAGAGTPLAGAPRRYPQQPYLRGRAGQTPMPPPAWFNQRPARGAQGQHGGPPSDQPSTAAAQSGGRLGDRPSPALGQYGEPSSERSGVPLSQPAGPPATERSGMTLSQPGGPPATERSGMTLGQPGGAASERSGAVPAQPVRPLDERTSASSTQPGHVGAVSGEPPRSGLPGQPPRAGLPGESLGAHSLGADRAGSAPDGPRHSIEPSGSAAEWASTSPSEPPSFPAGVEPRSVPDSERLARPEPAAEPDRPVEPTLPPTSTPTSIPTSMSTRRGRERQAEPEWSEPPTEWSEPSTRAESDRPSRPERRQPGAHRVARPDHQPPERARERRPEPSGPTLGARSESPIFEEMASAWFRENLELDRQGAGGWSAEGASESSGWDVGESLLRPMPEPAESSELTTAGLPKRRPRSRLIPGSPSGGDSAPASVPARSPDQVRGRLASYQQGVRQGRASRHRRLDTAGEHSAPENHWEENS